MAYWSFPDASPQQKRYIAQMCMFLKIPGMEYERMSKGSAGRHIRWLEPQMIEEKARRKVRRGK